MQGRMRDESGSQLMCGARASFHGAYLQARIKVYRCVCIVRVAARSRAAAATSVGDRRNVLSSPFCRLACCCGLHNLPVSLRRRRTKTEPCTLSTAPAARAAQQRGRPERRSRRRPRLLRTRGRRRPGQPAAPPRRLLPQLPHARQQPRHLCLWVFHVPCRGPFAPWAASVHLGGAAGPSDALLASVGCVVAEPGLVRDAGQLKARGAGAAVRGAAGAVAAAARALVEARAAVEQLRGAARALARSESGVRVISRCHCVAGIPAYYKTT